MSHLPFLPFAIPFSAAIVLLVLHHSDITVKRVVSLAATLAFAVVAVLILVTASDDQIRVYRLGNWAAPYGIVLVLDRLAAIMIAVTAALMLPVMIAAMAGTDTRGLYFHAIFQLQIAGIAGAFLTGDVLNL